MSRKPNTLGGLWVALVLSAVIPIVAYSETGFLDEDFAHFSDDGRVGILGMSTRAMALAEDGKIVTLGSLDERIVLKQFNADGTEDTRFLSGSYDLGSENVCEDFHSCGLAIQHDGRIIVVADTNLGGSRDFAIMRFYDDGLPDPTFGTDGMTIVDFDGKDDIPTDVAIQDGGKIVVVGTAGIEKSFSADADRFGILRLTADGGLDTGFSDDGKANTSFGSGLTGNENHYAHALAIQDDGKIVVVGAASDYINGGTDREFDWGFVRYNPNGTLDSTFSGDGKRMVGLGDFDQPYDVALDPDGKIVAVGHAEGPSRFVDTGNKIAVVRLEPGGDLDTTFSGNGILSTSLTAAEADEALHSVAVQSDGRIVAAGHADTRVRLFRFTDGGAFDGTFASTGHVSYRDGLARDLIIQPDGQYLMMYGDGIFRINLDSFPDHAGEALTSFGYGNDRAFDVTVQPDGKPVVVGESMQPGSRGQEFAVARYRADGQLDTTFGNHGMVLLGPKTGDDAGRSVVVQEDGKILVAGHSENTDFDFALHRLRQDGVRESGFTSYTDFGFGDDFAVSVLLQPDNKIVLVGFAEQPGIPGLSDRYGIALARFLPDGNLDVGFGDAGKVITLIPQGFDTTRARGAKLLDNGQILVVGTHDQDVAVLKYNADGTLDAGFGDGGIVLADRINSNDIGFGIDVIQNDHIAIGGLSGINDFSLLILAPDGGQCTVCGTLPVGEHYWRSIDFLGGQETAYALAVQDDGKILLTGNTISGASLPLTARMRRNSLIQGPGFRLDTTFGDDGRTFAGGNFDFDTSARAMALYGDGIFVAGYRFNGHDDDFFLMKLVNDSASYPDGKPDLIFMNGMED